MTHSNDLANTSIIAPSIGLSSGFRTECSWIEATPSPRLYKDADQWFKINLSEGTLGKLVFNDSLYNNMNALVYELRDFVKDLKDNPSKYMKAYRNSKK